MPKGVKTHGTGGYSKGCKCAVCRAAHAAYMREWRARKAAPARPDPAPLPPLASLPAIDPDAPPGRLELALTADLDGGATLDPGGPRVFLTALARFNARMLDQLPGLDRLDLVSPLESRTLDILARLQSKPSPEGLTDSDLERFMSSLNEPEGGQ